MISDIQKHIDVSFQEMIESNRSSWEMTSVKQITDITVQYQVMVPDEERYPETAIMTCIHTHLLNIHLT